MRIVHVELKEANDFIATHHRHHKKVVGHRFSIGLADFEGNLLGVAICSRPVARAVDYKNVVEVTRLCVADNGPKNACSMLYGACARAAKALGYKEIQTYILTSEPGTSLKASGWSVIGAVIGRSWTCPSRPRSDKHPTVDKTKYGKKL